MDKSIHQFSVKKVSGEEEQLSKYEGKVLLVVNTASECGLTPQLDGLEKLYQAYKDQSFVILGFPSNNFKEQEPLEGKALEEFCQINYGVTFPIYDKVNVKGEETAPLYEFLSNKKLNGQVNSTPKWNFHKYLIDKEGKVVDYFYPITTPDTGRLKRAIEKLL